MFKARPYLLATAALTTALVLAGCSGGGMGGMDMGSSSSSDTSDASATSNNADVMFAQMMIPHHEQAVEMSDVILAKDGIDDRVIALATQIKDAQEPEITQLKEWLGEWGAEESASDMDHNMDGMMSDDDMQALEAATGAEASKLFLEQMVKHHTGAIDMAQTEIADGKNADAKAMAETIVSTQTDEITTMQDLLATL